MLRLPEGYVYRLCRCSGMHQMPIRKVLYNNEGDIGSSVHCLSIRPAYVPSRQRCRRQLHLPVFSGFIWPGRWSMQVVCGWNIQKRFWHGSVLILSSKFKFNIAEHNQN